MNCRGNAGGIIQELSGGYCYWSATRNPVITGDDSHSSKKKMASSLLGLRRANVDDIRNYDKEVDGRVEI